MKMSLNVPVAQMLKIFKFKEELDAYEDTYHDGYSESDVLKSNLSLPRKYEDLDKMCPLVIARALEDSERNQIVQDLNQAQIDAIIESLEKINPGTVEYQDMENKFVTEPAYIDSAKFNKHDNTITINFVNPHHLINAILTGEGMFGAEIDSKEKPEEKEILKYLHHLPTYFAVWGESQSSGELDSRYSPSVSDSDFESAIENSLDCVSNEEMAQYIKDCVESERLTFKECEEILKNLKNFDLKEIKSQILTLSKDEVNESLSNLNDWQKILK